MDGKVHGRYIFLAYDNFEGGPFLLFLSLDVLRAHAGEGSSTIDMTKLLEGNIFALKPIDSGYRLRHVLGLSICDFGWMGLSSLPHILVYARLEHSSVSYTCIAAFEFYLDSEGSLHFKRQTRPLILPHNPPKMQRLSSSQSGRIFLKVFQNLRSRRSPDAHRGLYVVALDEDGELLYRSIFKSMDWTESIVEAVSTSGDVVRVTRRE